MYIMLRIEKEAFEQLEQAIDINPDDFYANALGYYYLKKEAI